MIIYPAIDIKHGACVRLVQGIEEMETQYYDDPVEPAKEFKKMGAEWVHVVDLDGAFKGEPHNWEIVERIAEVGLKVQLGGGLRTIEDIESVFKMGVSRVVVGTRACHDRDFVIELAKKFGDRIAVAIDAREGKVAVRGWVETTNTPAIALAQSVAEVGIKTIIFTDILTEGEMRGPNFEGHKEIWGAVSCDVIAAGGVHDRHDIVHFNNLSKRFPNLNGVVVGKALYEHKVDIKDMLSIVGE